jgi:hypothetical protein
MNCSLQSKLLSFYLLCAVNGLEIVLWGIWYVKLPTGWLAICVHSTKVASSGKWHARMSNRMTLKSRRSYTYKISLGGAGVSSWSSVKLETCETYGSGHGSHHKSSQKRAARDIKKQAFPHTWIRELLRPPLPRLPVFGPNDRRAPQRNPIYRWNMVWDCRSFLPGLVELWLGPKGMLLRKLDHVDTTSSV